jgi:hypothetical protein
MFALDQQITNRAVLGAGTRSRSTAPEGDPVPKQAVERRAH